MGELTDGNTSAQSPNREVQLLSLTGLPAARLPACLVSHDPLALLLLGTRPIVPPDACAPP